MHRQKELSTCHWPLAGLAAAILIALACDSSFGIDDWPHWRGAQRNDISSETGLLKSWPASGPPKVWTNSEVGLGYAGISVVGNRLYTLGTEESEGEFAVCLDATTGKQIWRTSFASIDLNRGGSTRRWGDGSRSTPTVDGNRVYVMGASGVLACLESSSGQLVWKKAMSEFGGSVPAWGYSESPLVDGPHVVCTPGGNRGAMVALNKMTGEKVWQSSAVKDKAHYSSILPMELDGKLQYVQLLVSQVVGVAPNSGELLWSVPWEGRIAVIPSPVNADGQVYVTSGYGTGAMLVCVKNNNAKRVWYEKQSMQNHHGGVVFVDGHVYGFSDVRKSFTCQNAKTGKVIWRDKAVKKGAVMYADGLFYHIEERGGKVLLIKATPAGMKVISSFVLDPLSKRRSPYGGVWVHPVIANGKLYLRDQEFLSCFDVSAK